MGGMMPPGGDMGGMPRVWVWAASGGDMGGMMPPGGDMGGGVGDGGWRCSPAVTWVVCPAVTWAV